MNGRNAYRFFAIVLFSFLFFIPGSQAQQASIQNVYGRDILSLNGRWAYIIDPYETGYYDYRHQPYDQSASGKGGYYDDRRPGNKGALLEYDFDHSPSMNVPGDWNSQDERLLLYEGTVWLRRKFQAFPQSQKKYLLYFGAVNYEAHVYLNGKKLGMHRGGFTPFQFDVTSLLREGENVLVVKADNTRHVDAIPTVNTDWWNYGGITRDVMLVALPDMFIQDYKIQLAKSKPNLLEGFVQLKGRQGSQTVLVSIPEAGIRQPLRTNDTGFAALQIPVKNLQYWTPEQPKLYDVRIESATDTVRDKIGFRTIDTRGQDILLNGKPVFLRGICLHDENPLIPGRLRGEGDMRMMLQWAKDLHCNYVRLAHYPHSEEMLHLADEMGLMVWAEVPVYWTISWTNADTYTNARQQLTDLVNRDKNRSSVVIWSIGNETPLSDERHRFMGNLARKARSLDDTRLITAALETHQTKDSVIVDDPLGALLDIVSFNEYAGWYWSNPKDMAKFHFSVHYNKPVLISEFGGGALAGYHADDDTRFSEEYQATLYRNQFPMLLAIPGLRGMTPWILADFRSPKRQNPELQDYWNRKGLISETGKKKQAFFLLKAFYEQMEVRYR